MVATLSSNLGKVLSCAIGNRRIVGNLCAVTGIYSEGITAKAVSHVVEKESSPLRLALASSLPPKNSGAANALGCTVLFISDVGLVEVNAR